MRAFFGHLAILTLSTAALSCTYDLDAFRNEARSRTGALDAGGDDASEDSGRGLGDLDAGRGDGAAGAGGAGESGAGPGPAGTGGAGSGAGGMDADLGGAGGAGDAGDADVEPSDADTRLEDGGEVGMDAGPGGGAGGAGDADVEPSDADTGGETAPDCESVCTDPCYSCDVPEQLGTCAPVPSGTDPHDDCGSCDVCDGEGSCRPVDANEADPKGQCTDGGDTDECGQNGLCDGEGECAYKLAADALCQTTCADGELSIWSCTEERSCEVSSTNPCPVSGGGECNETGDDCIYVCGDDSECPSDTHFCCQTGDDALCDVSSDLDTCVRKSNQGDGCVDDRQCITGHCTDGVCCTTADCPGACNSCSIPDASPGQCSHYDDSDAVGSNDAPDGTCSPSLCRGCNGVSDDCVDVAGGEDWNENCEAQPPSSCGFTGTCDGTGACAFHGAGTECDDGLFCTGEDTCDGAGSCDNHTGDPCAGGDACNNTCDDDADNCFTPTGTACGDATDNACTDPDQCDGSGGCDPRHALMGTACGDATDNACTDPDSCDGAGGCDPRHASTMTSCGDSTDDACTDPDTCDGSGGCDPHNASAGTPCGDTRDDICTDPDTCDGSGVCDPHNASEGTPCGDATDNACTDPDTCNGAGVCMANHQCWLVPPTNQDACYDNLSLITCTAFPCNADGSPDFCGQDAQYPDNERTFYESGPSVYDFDGDGDKDEVVTDTFTGLIWQGESGSSGPWADAVAYCSGLNSANAGAGYAGYTGWRLPDYHELASLLSRGHHNPASVFPGIGNGQFWSSSPDASNNASAWYLNFYYGTMFEGNKVDQNHRAKCVRGGPWTADASGRFSVSGSSGQETVLDQATGLRWDKRPLETMSWQSALEHCEGLNYGGYSDWRLPSESELRSLINIEISSDADTPATDFPDMASDYYWTSSGDIFLTDNAWYVDFRFGRLTRPSKTSYQAVKCVRGGP